jgi:hypothetical protein
VIPLFPGGTLKLAIAGPSSYPNNPPLLLLLSPYRPTYIKKKHTPHLAAPFLLLDLLKLTNSIPFSFTAKTTPFLKQTSSIPHCKQLRSHLLNANIILHHYNNNNINKHPLPFSSSRASSSPTPNTT